MKFGMVTQLSFLKKIIPKLLYKKSLLKKNPSDIFVSVSVITFNHVSFIKECLESILNQKTNFDFEILIHDDASTDGTTQIIEEYQAQNPNLIFPMIQKENQYSKGIRGINFRYNFPRAQGKYIALCEGDDYWIDEYKLQKQVDFLEKTKDASTCIHRCEVLRGNSIVRCTEYLNFPINSLEQLYTNWGNIKTPTLMFKAVKNLVPLHLMKNILAGDLLLCTFLLKYGSIYCLPDAMAAYRKHEDGITNKVKIKNDLIFKLSNLKYLQSLLSDDNFKEDWSFIHSYTIKVLNQCSQLLKEMQEKINKCEEKKDSFYKKMFNKIFNINET